MTLELRRPLLLSNCRTPCTIQWLCLAGAELRLLLLCLLRRVGCNVRATCALHRMAWRQSLQKDTW